jgi:hypothetical protein
MAGISTGSVLFNERGYLVAEVLGDASRVIGFALIGPHASESIIYASQAQALEALQDIEARVS